MATSKVEYRIRPRMRYEITRYYENEDGSAGVESRGEYDNGDVAYEVAYALAKAEHDRLGWPVGDERMQYPRPSQRGAILGGNLAELQAENLRRMTEGQIIGTPGASA
ncbi:MAG: hypothetical protein AB7O95_13495 [Geminicoccaceae bacterium]